MSLPSRLYRFDQLKYATRFIELGSVSFGIADSYIDIHLSDAQRDNELSRTSALDVARHELFTASSGEKPRKLQNLLGVQQTFDIKDAKGDPLQYYILSCSMSNDKEYYLQFPKADCCITVQDPVEFHRRLKAALCAQLPEWSCAYNFVTYFPQGNLILPAKKVDLLFMKDTLYARQQEFRFALIRPYTHSPANRVFLTLGCLKDICSLVLKT